MCPICNGFRCDGDSVCPEVEEDVVNGDEPIDNVWEESCELGKVWE